MGIKIWVNPYLGYPEILAFDQGLQFTNNLWKSFLQKYGITTQPSGVEIHNAFGVNERYHAYLRSIYRETEEDDPSIRKEQALAMALKAVNDTAGPNGLVPTLLVFGAIPRLPVTAEELLAQSLPIKQMVMARKEMGRIAAQTRLETALRRNVPCAADSDIRVGDYVLMYREKPIGKWVGPYMVVNLKGKVTTLNTGDRLLNASVDKRKPHIEHSDPPPPISDNSIVRDDDISEEVEQLRRIMHRVEDPSPVIQDTVTDVNGNNASTTMDELDRLPGNDVLSSDSKDDQLPIDTLVVKILKNSDERAQYPDFKSAMEIEVNVFKARGMWQKVLRSDTVKDGIIIGGRFLLTLKNYGTPTEKAKVRYVAQGYNDREQPYIVHDMATLRAAQKRPST